METSPSLICRQHDNKTTRERLRIRSARAWGENTKVEKTLSIVLFAALFLLASALTVNTALADAPVVDRVQPWTRTSYKHVILNITITHYNYYTGHYVDWIQVDIDGTVDTVNLSPPQPLNQPFVVEYDMGVVSANLTIRAMANCNIHGSSGWSTPVQIGGDGGDGTRNGGPRGGLVNPNATSSADFTLLLQIVIFVVLLAGLVVARVKRGFVKHGAIMCVAVALHTISILIAMVPSLLRSSGLFESWSGSLPLAVASHAVIGILVEVLGAYLVLTWALHPKEVKPCFKRKSIMRVVLVCWLIELILGAYVYILLYMPA